MVFGWFMCVCGYARYLSMSSCSLLNFGLFDNIIRQNKEGGNSSFQVCCIFRGQFFANLNFAFDMRLTLLQQTHHEDDKAAKEGDILLNFQTNSLHSFFIHFLHYQNYLIT